MKIVLTLKANNQMIRFHDVEGIWLDETHQDEWIICYIDDGGCRNKFHIKQSDFVDAHILQEDCKNDLE